MTHYLSVPKWEDIRKVYNGASSGLNDVLWDNDFSLSEVRTTLKATGEGTYMADRGVG